MKQVVQDYFKLCEEVDINKASIGLGFAWGQVDYVLIVDTQAGIW